MDEYPTLDETELLKIRNKIAEGLQLTEEELQTMGFFIEWFFSNQLNGSQLYEKRCAMDKLKKELSELIDKLANAKDGKECDVLLEAIEKRAWVVYATRIKELTS